MPGRERIQKSEAPLPVLKFREKRKWQINFRRYVLQKSPCSAYAPYFGLDIENMRRWFEYQFQGDSGWDNFGKMWQFDHIIPVTYFDFSNEEDLKLCWNFTNIRVEHFPKNNNRGNRLDVLAAKNFFKGLFETTQYEPCQALLQKIDKIELFEFVNINAQKAFILDNRDYLRLIEGYSFFEFELLNSGRSIEEVRKEIDFLKKLEK